MSSLYVLGIQHTETFNFNPWDQLSHGEVGLGLESDNQVQGRSGRWRGQRESLGPWHTGSMSRSSASSSPAPMSSAR